MSTTLNDSAMWAAGLLIGLFNTKLSGDNGSVFEDYETILANGFSISNPVGSPSSFFHDPSINSLFGLHNITSDSNFSTGQDDLHVQQQNGASFGLQSIQLGCDITQDLTIIGNTTSGSTVSEVVQVNPLEGLETFSFSSAFGNLASFDVYSYPNHDGGTINGQPFAFDNIVLNGNSLPPANTADMIMRDGNNGDYEIYALGSNDILAAGPLGQVGLEWKVAGIGAFDSPDTSDMILRDSNTGQFEIYDISNDNLTGAAPMGQVGLEWSVSGFGDFSSRVGESDMLMRNSNTGQFEIYDLANNAVRSAAPMGQVGLEWSVAGFGDFSTRPNESDMLMRNSNTGAFELYDISNNQITSAATMGQVGLEWSVAGFGDFSGNANETDMLMRNKNTGAFEIYDISNNQITSAATMGQVGLEWSVVGFGPVNGAGTSDMLMRNTNTGAFEVYDITHNQLTTAASMGQVGLEWSVAGIAADPPGGSAPANLQLAQAMASYAPANSIPDTNPTAIEGMSLAGSTALVASQVPHTVSA